MELNTDYAVGWKYEGKDIHGDWRLITLTSENLDGTFQAVVHDGFNTLWRHVHRANLRRQRATRGLLPIPKEHGEKTETVPRVRVEETGIRTPSTCPNSSRSDRGNTFIGTGYASPSPYYGYQYGYGTNKKTGSASSHRAYYYDMQYYSTQYPYGCHSMRPAQQPFPSAYDQQVGSMGAFGIDGTYHTSPISSALDQFSQSHVTPAQMYCSQPPLDNAQHMHQHGDQQTMSPYPPSLAPSIQYTTTLQPPPDQYTQIEAPQALNAQYMTPQTSNAHLDASQAPNQPPTPTGQLRAPQTPNNAQLNAPQTPNAQFSTSQTPNAQSNAVQTPNNGQLPDPQIPGPQTQPGTPQTATGQYIAQQVTGNGKFTCFPRVPPSYTIVPPPTTCSAGQSSPVKFDPNTLPPDFSSSQSFPNSPQSSHSRVMLVQQRNYGSPQHFVVSPTSSVIAFDPPTRFAHPLSPTRLLCEETYPRTTHSLGDFDQKSLASEEPDEDEEGSPKHSESKLTIGDNVHQPEVPHPAPKEADNEERGEDSRGTKEALSAEEQDVRYDTREYKSRTDALSQLEWEGYDSDYGYRPKSRKYSDDSSYTYNPYSNKCTHAGGSYHAAYQYRTTQANDNKSNAVTKKYGSQYKTPANGSDYLSHANPTNTEGYIYSERNGYQSQCDRGNYKNSSNAYVYNDYYADKNDGYYSSRYNKFYGFKNYQNLPTQPCSKYGSNPKASVSKNFSPLQSSNSRNTCEKLNWQQKSDDWMNVDSFAATGDTYTNRTPSPGVTPPLSWRKVVKKEESREDTLSTTVTSGTAEDMVSTEENGEETEIKNERSSQYSKKRTSATSMSNRSYDVKSRVKNAHPLIMTYADDPKNVIIAWQKLQPKDRKKCLEDLLDIGIKSSDSAEEEAIIAVFSAILKHGVKKQWLKHLNRTLVNVPAGSRKILWRKLIQLLEEF